MRLCISVFDNLVNLPKNFDRLLGSRQYYVKGKKEEEEKNLVSFR